MRSIWGYIIELVGGYKRTLIFVFMEVKLTSFVALPCSSFFCSVCVLCKFMSPGPFIWIWSSCSSFWSLQEAKDIINTLLLLGTRKKAHPGGSNKWIYFGNQNAEASLGPDMLSALSLMHESLGSCPFVIKKKRTRCRKKECRREGLTEVAVLERGLFFCKKVWSSLFCRFCWCKELWSWD